MDEKSFTRVVSNLLSRTSLEWFPPADAVIPTARVGDDQMLAEITIHGESIQLLENIYMDPPSQIADLASQLQDALVELAPQLRLEPVWPSCPRHPHSHPLNATVVNEEPVWACPRDNEVVRRIA